LDNKQTRTFFLSLNLYYKRNNIAIFFKPFFFGFIWTCTEVSALKRYEKGPLINSAALHPSFLVHNLDMVAPPCSLSSSSTPSVHCSHSIRKIHSSLSWDSSSSSPYSLKLSPQTKKFRIRCSEKPSVTLKTCKNCKTQFDPALNHPRACRFHTAHFGGNPISSFSLPPSPSGYDVELTNYKCIST